MKRYILIVLAVSIFIIIIFDSTHGLGLDVYSRIKDWLKWGSMFGKVCYFTSISGLLALNCIMWMGVIKLYQIIKSWDG